MINTKTGFRVKTSSGKITKRLSPKCPLKPLSEFYSPDKMDGGTEMETRKEVIETLKANSFSGRYAKVGSDFKVYFDTLEELKTGIDAVIEGKKYLEGQLMAEVKEIDTAAFGKVETIDLEGVE